MREGGWRERDRHRDTHRQRRVLVQLVLGGDAKASVVAASCPGQSHSCLQLLVHLLVDGASELSAVIPVGGDTVRGGDTGGPWS